MGRIKEAELEALAPVETSAETTALIVVKQLPIITERLRDVKEAVEATVAEAKSLVATTDNLQAVKNRRAELNKQFADLEAQRKAVKKQIMVPYDRFEAVYKECISIPFSEADSTLKNTIDGVEKEIKQKASARLEEYYNELCSMEGIDWLPFSKAMLASGTRVGLADCRTKEPKKAMDNLANFVSKIALGLDQIRQMEDSAEILVEYKKTLDAGAAAALVAERKRKIIEAKEAEEKRKVDEAKRKEMIARVEAWTPPEETASPTTEEPVFPEFRFTVYNCTRSQLIKVREFLKAEGIKYA